MSVLRVLWMSTHGCFAFLFPIDDTSVDGTQEPDTTAGDYYNESPGDHFFLFESAEQE